MTSFWQKDSEQQENKLLTKLFNAADAVVAIENEPSPNIDDFGSLCEAELHIDPHERLDRVHAQLPHLEAWIFLLAARHEGTAISVCKQYGFEDETYARSAAGDVFASAHDFLVSANDPTAQIVAQNQTHFAYLLTKAVVESRGDDPYGNAHLRTKIDATLQECTKYSHISGDELACRLVTTGLKRLDKLEKYVSDSGANLIRQTLLDSFSKHAKGLCTFHSSTYCHHNPNVLQLLRQTIQSERIPLQSRTLAANAYSNIVWALPRETRDAEVAKLHTKDGLPSSIQSAVVLQTPTGPVSRLASEFKRLLRIGAG